MRTIMKTYFQTSKAKSLVTFACAFLFCITLTAQDTKFRDPSIRYGLNLGMQYNTASLGWQTLHGTDWNFHSPENNIDRVDGNGYGLYGGIFVTYLSNSWWGIQIHMAYEERNALVEDITKSPVVSFDTKMNYLSFAPMLRIDQNLIPRLNFYIGPLISVNLTGLIIIHNCYENT